MNPLAAIADRVIDGDTLWIRIRVRTRKSQPELGTRQGDAAAREAKARWPKGTALLVEGFAADEYGRLVATVTKGKL